MSGVVAMSAAVSVSFLAAAGVSIPAPFFAVGSVVIDRTTPQVREWVIERFGTDDKILLFTVLGVVLGVLGALGGALERRTCPVGSAVLVGCGALGCAAALPQIAVSSWIALLPALAAAVTGVLVLRGLLGFLPRAGADEGPSTDSPSQGSTALGRRAFAISLAAAAAASALGVLVTTGVSRLRSVAAERLSTTLPKPASPAPPAPAGAAVLGAVPYVTSNSDFFRIDTSLAVPQLSQQEWRLRIFGMVEKELVLTWADLVAMPMIERAVTLTCVSNEIGGDLIGNAVWLGVPMASVLERAGVSQDADMLLSRSVDGWTAGTPLAAVRDGRDAILVIGMNGQPLPFEHGYPVRQVVPGLYGYVSATKWLAEWEITRFDRAKAYWSTRGWSERGPIKLASRIENPKQSAALAAGRVVVAGSAWAQHVGVWKVEVAVDDGPWQNAQLAQEHSVDTWRQWWWEWAAEPGEHTIRCRAYDHDGRLQAQRPARPAPDGATGWQQRVVRIT